MLSSFEKTDTNDELPKNMYQKFAVQKVEWKGFPVFIIRNRNKEKRGKKAILFLAGANLAFSLVHRMKKRPGKLIVISPAPGLENGKDRSIRKAMENIDPILNVEMNDLIAENWAKNVPLDSPDINPEYIDYHNFPKILMLYGSHELFYPHVKRLIRKIREDGAMLETIEKPMCHDWALCSFFPEGRRAMKKMREFILE